MIYHGHITINTVAAILNLDFKFGIFATIDTKIIHNYRTFRGKLFEICYFLVVSLTFRLINFQPACFFQNCANNKCFLKLILFWKLFKCLLNYFLVYVCVTYKSQRILCFFFKDFF